jgi:hypothetical protein
VGDDLALPPSWQPGGLFDTRDHRARDEAICLNPRAFHLGALQRAREPAHSRDERTAYRIEVLRLDVELPVIRGELFKVWNQDFWPINVLCDCE